MYQSLRVGRLALLSVFFLLVAKAQASHMVGGDITYRSLGNNQYRVVAHLIQSCGSVNFFPTLTLNYRNTGCAGAGTNATMVQTSSTTGSPYCPLAPGGSSPCSASLPGFSNNYFITNYEATVTLPPGRWVLSTNESARSELANVVGQANLYMESVLDNTSGISNNSAVPATAPIQFVGWQQPNQFSSLMFDPDGDSLVYSLAAPLQNCNDPIAYRRVIGDNGSSFIDLTAQNGTPCLASIQANSTYSATFPMASYAYTGTCALMNTVPAFGFSAQTGEMLITPAIHFSATNAPINGHVIVVKVDEYRRQANGTYVLVGSVRREMVAIEIDLADRNPTLSTMAVNSTARPITSTIPAPTGQPLSIQLASTDADAGQIVTLTSNASLLLDGATLVATGNGTATLTWTPPVGLRPGLYYCTIISTDNACPIKGIEHRTLAFRVSAGPLATRGSKPTTTLAAVPTPFTETVSFQLAQPGVQTVTVFDQLGRQVAELRSQPSGRVQWQPAATVPAGLYLACSQDGRQVARLLRTGTE